MTTSEKTNTLGGVTAWHSDGQNITFTSAHGRCSITILTPTIVRVRVTPNAQFQPRRSWSPAVADSDFAPTTFTTNEDNDNLIIATDALTLRVSRADSRITIEDTQGRVICEDIEGVAWLPKGGVVCSKRIPTNEHYYGFGERTGLLDKLSQSYTNWTVDRGLHGPVTDEMYQAHPFFMALRPGEGMGYGLYFNNTYRTIFDMGRTTSGTYSFTAEGGDLDYYVIYGPTPAQIVEGYTAIVGRIELPPLWALGYHQSRYTYHPHTQLREVAADFRKRNIPCDVLVLDIDYMEGYRVFTWDTEHYPDPATLITDLRAQGFRVVPIIDPGVKNDPQKYPVYDTGAAIEGFVRDPQTSKYVTGYVWPGECVFPDFSRADVRQWWGDQHKTLLEQGIAGVWNDMNEPAAFDTGFDVGEGQICPIEFPKEARIGRGASDETHWSEIHNLYGYLEDMATHNALKTQRPNVRPFILTRSGFAGIQKYAAVWTGDNNSVWEHLQMALPMLMNMGLSGITFCGTDIGGFGGNATSELFARWMQFGALSPFARGHSAKWTEMHEPWVFGEEVERISRRYLELRYQLLPYLYTLFEEATRSGAPILRPVLYHFPDDPMTTHLDDQVMLGGALLAAPVTLPGRTHRYVYLPEGKWYDFWGKNPPISGPAHILADAPLDTLPLYVRGGSIVPLGEIIQHTDARDPAAPLTLRVYPDADGTAIGTLYEDAGEGYDYQQGNYCRTTFTYRATLDGQQLDIWSEGIYQSGRSHIVLMLPTGQSVTVNNADGTVDVALS